MHILGPWENGRKAIGCRLSLSSLSNRSGLKESGSGKCLSSLCMANTGIWDGNC